MLTPKQTAATLQVSTSTLRRWSSEFEPFLGQRTGIKRLYSTDDLAVLARIKELYKQGMNTAQVAEALPVVKNTNSALINITDFANALALSRADNAKLAQSVDDLNSRLTALESYLSLPWYRKLGKPGGGK